MADPTGSAGLPFSPVRSDEIPPLPKVPIIRTAVISVSTEDVATGGFQGGSQGVATTPLDLTLPATDAYAAKSGYGTTELEEDSQRPLTGKRSILAVGLRLRVRVFMSFTLMSIRCLSMA